MIDVKNHDHKLADGQATPRKGRFVAMTRSEEILELIEAAPLAFALAAIIALRAKLTPGVSLKGLEQGEAFIGDHAKFGMSRQQYRTACRQLIKWHFATIKSTNRGTTAKLIDTRLFDVLRGLDQPAEQPAGQPPKQPQTKTSDQRPKTKDLGSSNNGSSAKTPSDLLSSGKPDGPEPRPKKVLKVEGQVHPFPLRRKTSPELFDRIEALGDDCDDHGHDIAERFVDWLNAGTVKRVSNLDALFERFREKFP